VRARASKEKKKRGADPNRPSDCIHLPAANKFYRSEKPFAQNSSRLSRSSSRLEANCTLFCLEVLFLFRSLSTDPRALLCKRRVEDFHRAQIVKFVSFSGSFTGKYVVKYVPEISSKLSKASQKRPVKMRQSLISPIKLHVFVGSRRHQKMRMYVIQGCANLWSTSMSFLRVTCDAARGLQHPKETCKRWTG